MMLTHLEAGDTPAEIAQKRGAHKQVLHKARATLAKKARRIAAIVDAGNGADRAQTVGDRR